MTLSAMSVEVAAKLRSALTTPLLALVNEPVPVLTLAAMFGKTDNLVSMAELLPVI